MISFIYCGMEKRGQVGYPALHSKLEWIIEPIAAFKKLLNKIVRLTVIPA
jgi:hypothetical protein